MLLRTHIIIGLFFALLINSYFDFGFWFVAIVVIASVIPDIDNRFSRVGKRFVFRPLQFFVRHRGLLHSFIFLILISGILFLFSEILGLGFLIGYGSHLITDCFSIQGLELFYPFGFRINGFVRTGRIIENLIFVLFFIGDVWLLYKFL